MYLDILKVRVAVAIIYFIIVMLLYVMHKARRNKRW